MTPEQYKEAAKAISDFRWILAAALSSTSIEHTKESKKRMNQLAELRDALEAEGMRAAPSIAQDGQKSETGHG